MLVLLLLLYNAGHILGRFVRKKSQKFKWSLKSQFTTVQQHTVSEARQASSNALHDFEDFAVLTLLFTEYRQLRNVFSEE